MSAGDCVQAVVFNLGGETFALPVGTVREILDYRPPVRLPQGPAWFAGLIDVRGVSVPTIELRTRLGQSAGSADAMTRILVVDVPIDGQVLTLGMIVDRVLDVATFASEAIERSPEIGVRWRSNYIEGVVRRESGFIVLLAADQIFSIDDEPSSSDLDQAA